MLIENEYIKLNKIDKISARVIFLLFILAICIILNHLISYIFAFIYFIVSSYNIKKILNEKPKKFYNHTEHIKSINIDKNYIEIIKIDNQSKLYNKEDLKKIIIDINLGNATFGQWYSDTLIYKLIIKFEIDNEQQYRLETYKYKNINPNLKLYVIATLMRCPRNTTNEEEPDYYGEVGEEIFKYGVLKNKYELKLITKEEFDKESQSLLKKISYCYKDFENRRAINLTLLLKFLEVSKTLADFLVIPQDDSAPFGYTRMDNDVVKNKIKELSLNVNVYAGSDEVGMVVIARAIKDDLGITPEIEIVYPQEECKSIIPMYEDTELQITLSKQLDTVGFKTSLNSNLKLYMNYPTKNMVNMGSKPSDGYEERNLPQFVNNIVSDIKNGKTVLLCDGAYGNGGEELVLKLIQEQTSLFNLGSYAGWNTSSNTLGTVLAQGMLIALFGKRKIDNDFLALRVFEDIGYCGAVRWYIWHEVVDKYGYSYYDIGEKDGIIAKIIKENLNNYMEENFKEIFSKYKLTKCISPWHRIFEIELEVSKK